MIPPSKSKGIFSDVRHFFIHKPSRPTLIKFATEEQRVDYSQRMMQRLGIVVAEYSVLNVHRIGVDVPVKYVFEELLKWDGDSTCWPNHIATVERLDGQLEHIHIFLFGQKLPFLKSNLLFKLNAVKFQHLPRSCDFDNDRFLLYESSGGYPIGFFTMYVRSPITKLNEAERAQLFFAVGFNFYGKEGRSRKNIINIIWEKIHNRVTANVMNRFKQLCEWRFERLESGLYHKKPE